MVDKKFDDNADPFTQAELLVVGVTTEPTRAIVVVVEDLVNTCDLQFRDNSGTVSMFLAKGVIYPFSITRYEDSVGNYVIWGLW